jgi:simple sugar transport system ATP-binding protein/ribose transport system ATP-binding protein
MTTTTGREPHVSLLNISKRFGGVQALDDVTVRIAAGAVHALVGENGAGKSTLSKVCSGVLSPDAGSVVIDGTPVALRSPRDALLHGIATIAQELALVPHLSVEQNVFLGSEPAVGAFLKPRALRKAFNELVADAGFDLDPAALVGALRTADQQKVEILRALSRGASMIIMDEPTAALSGPDTDRLHAVIKDLARTGHTVVLISHFLSEVLELADTVTILRDGKHVRTAPARDETNASLIEGMLGRTLESVFPDKPPTPSSDARVVLAASNVTAPGISGVSIDVRAGEIVGLAGLVGAGRTELARALTGAAAATSGDVLLRGEKVAMRSPRQALRRGVVMIPESRKEQGLVLQRAIAENITLANLSTYSRAGLVARRREHGAVRRVLERVRVKAPALGAPIAGLSGGNQQKALFARALLCSPSVLLADEPTRGVDVGSRRAIYDLIVEQARAGVGVVVISSDVEEVLGLAHRVVVMRGGRVVAELSGERMTEANVLHAAFAEKDANADANVSQEPGGASQ